MDNATPVTEANPETSQPVEEVKDSTQEIIQMLSTIQFLLSKGSFNGSEAHLVVMSTQFLIDFKKHLESVKKVK